MTSQDFSQEFDILYNNISSNQAPGLTEYEKSVFLTQAQEALVLDLYKGITGDSFETTEEVTRYLSSLVKTFEFNIPHPLIPLEKDYYEFIVEPSAIEDLWFITYQSGLINVNDNFRNVLVVPAKQDSLFKDLNNPFKGPNKNKILSLTQDDFITLYSKYPLVTYYIKYLKRPVPIVLFDSEYSVEGIEPPSELESFKIDLPESLHRQILLRAVQMAKAVWQS